MTRCRSGGKGRLNGSHVAYARLGGQRADEGWADADLDGKGDLRAAMKPTQGLDEAVGQRIGYADALKPSQ